MPLELLCGPANSGKVRTVVDRVLRDCAQGPGAWLLVPTASDIRRAREELATRGGLVLGARIGTFHHLVRELAGEPLARDLTPATASVLVRRAVDGVPAFRRAARFDGLVETARRRLGELRAAQAAGDDALERALGRLPWPERRPWTALLRAWGDLLDEHGLRDDAWFERCAIRRLSVGEAHAVPVHAYGFDDLTEAQERILVAVARREQVTVSLPFVRGRLAFARRQALVDRLVASGATVHDRGTAAFGVAALAELEARYHEPTADPVALPPGAATTSPVVSFVECCGDLQQAEQVVHEVAALIASGVLPGQVACLTASPAASRPLLEAAFRRAGIAATFELPRAVSDTPAGRTVLDGLDAALDGEAAALTAGLRGRTSSVLRADVDAWELASRERLAAASDRAGRIATWGAESWVPSPLRALARLGGDRRDVSIAPLVREYVASLAPATAGDVRLLAALVQALDDVVDVAGERQPTLRELRAALAAVPIPAPEQREPDAVVVAPVTRVRTERFDAVVLYDLHSGGFSAGPGDADEAPLVARELAYVGFTRAWRAVRFVRQAAGADGRMRAPHPVWMELRRLAPDAPLERRGLDEVAPSVTAARTRDELVRAASLHAGEHGIEALRRHREVHALVPDAAAPREAVAGDSFAGEMTAIDSLRVTDVEGYAGCPSRWFTQRHLLPRDPAGPSRRQVVGMLVHEALAELVPAMAGGGAPPQVEAVEASVLRAATAISRTAVVRPIDRARAVAVAERFLRDEQVDAPRVRTEVPFGGAGDDLPPARVGGIELRGRIDRIDLYDDGRALVHDYKLSSSATPAAKLVDEGRLQAPLYLHALRDAAVLEPVGAVYRPLEGVRPRGVLRAADAPALPGEYRTDRLDEEAFDELVEAALAEAERCVEGIRAGAVPTAPAIGRDCPSWCDLQAISRVEGR